MKNLQNILIWSKKQYNMKSVRAVTMQKYYNQINNMKFQSSKTVSFTIRLCNTWKNCKNIFLQMCKMLNIYYQIPFCPSSIKIENFKNNVN